LASACAHLLAHEQSRIEEGPRGNHERLALDRAGARLERLDTPRLDHHPERLAGQQLDATVREQLGGCPAIEGPISLEPRALDCGPLAPVQHPTVDRGSVGCACHQSVKHVELANEMTLSDAPDRRVARHLPDILGAEGDQPHPSSAARRGGRGFAAGVSASDDQHVVHDQRLYPNLAPLATCST